MRASLGTSAPPGGFASIGGGSQWNRWAICHVPVVVFVFCVFFSLFFLLFFSGSLDYLDRSMGSGKSSTMLLVFIGFSG